MHVVSLPPEGLGALPPYDPATGAHYWAVPVLFRIADPLSCEGPAILDGENLVYVGPPRCYYCEEPYSPTVARARCPGQTEEQ